MKKLIPLCAIGAVMLAACSGEKGKSTEDSLQQVTLQYEQASSFNDSLLLLMGISTMALTPSTCRKDSSTAWTKGARSLTVAQKCARTSRA
ncbi:MAG: hypothetical protein K2H72_08555 [Muribaculaceae bacterium]|nr:hypothetical protein [Muribaculaceae bacterium]